MSGPRERSPEWMYNLEDKYEAVVVNAEGKIVPEQPQTPPSPEQPNITPPPVEQSVITLLPQKAARKRVFSIIKSGPQRGLIVEKNIQQKYTIRCVAPKKRRRLQASDSDEVPGLNTAAQPPCDVFIQGSDGLLTPAVSARLRVSLPLLRPLLDLPHSGVICVQGVTSACWLHILSYIHTKQVPVVPLCERASLAEAASRLQLTELSTQLLSSDGEPPSNKNAVPSNESVVHSNRSTPPTNTSIAPSNSNAKTSSKSSVPRSKKPKGVSSSENDAPISSDVYSDGKDALINKKALLSSKDSASRNRRAKSRNAAVAPKVRNSSRRNAVAMTSSNAADVTVEHNNDFSTKSSNNDATVALSNKSQKAASSNCLEAPNDESSEPRNIFSSIQDSFDMPGNNSALDNTSTAFKESVCDTQPQEADTSLEDEMDSSQNARTQMNFSTDSCRLLTETTETEEEVAVVGKSLMLPSNKNKEDVVPSTDKEDVDLDSVDDDALPSDDGDYSDNHDQGLLLPKVWGAYDNSGDSITSSRDDKTVKSSSDNSTDKTSNANLQANTAGSHGNQLASQMAGWENVFVKFLQRGKCDSVGSSDVGTVPNSTTNSNAVSGDVMTGVTDTSAMDTSDTSPKVSVVNEQGMEKTTAKRTIKSVVKGTNKHVLRSRKAKKMNSDRKRASVSPPPAEDRLPAGSHIPSSVQSEDKPAQLIQKSVNTHLLQSARRLLAGVKPGNKVASSDLTGGRSGERKRLRGRKMDPESEKMDLMDKSNSDLKSCKNEKRKGLRGNEMESSLDPESEKMDVDLTEKSLNEKSNISNDGESGGKLSSDVCDKDHEATDTMSVGSCSDDVCVKSKRTHSHGASSDESIKTGSREVIERSRSSPSLGRNLLKFTPMKRVIVTKPDVKGNYKEGKKAHCENLVSGMDNENNMVNSHEPDNEQTPSKKRKLRSPLKSTSPSNSSQNSSAKSRKNSLQNSENDSLSNIDKEKVTDVQDKVCKDNDVSVKVSVNTEKVEFEIRRQPSCVVTATSPTNGNLQNVEVRMSRSNGQAGQSDDLTIRSRVNAIEQKTKLMSDSDYQGNRTEVVENNDEWVDITDIVHAVESGDFNAEKNTDKSIGDDSSGENCALNSSVSNKNPDTSLNLPVKDKELGVSSSVITNKDTNGNSSVSDKDASVKDENNDSAGEDEEDDDIDCSGLEDSFEADGTKESEDVIDARRRRRDDFCSTVREWVESSPAASVLTPLSSFRPAAGQTNHSGHLLVHLPEHLRVLYLRRVLHCPDHLLEQPRSLAQLQAELEDSIVKASAHKPKQSLVYFRMEEDEAAATKTSGGGDTTEANRGQNGVSEGQNEASGGKDEPSEGEKAESGGSEKGMSLPAEKRRPHIVKLSLPFMRTHQEAYRCKLCSEKFFGKDAAMEHQNRAVNCHSTRKADGSSKLIYQCARCVFVFLRPADFVSHVRATRCYRADLWALRGAVETQRSAAPLYWCRRCHRLLYSQQGAELHAARTRPCRPVPSSSRSHKQQAAMARRTCGACRRVFASARERDAHTNRSPCQLPPTYTDSVGEIVARVFPCGLCEESAASLRELKTHVDAQHARSEFLLAAGLYNARKYICQVCRAVRSTPKYSEHLWRDHGVKVAGASSQHFLSCPECKWRTIYVSKMRVHSQKHSPAKRRNRCNRQKQQQQQQQQQQQNALQDDDINISIETAASSPKKQDTAEVSPRKQHTGLPDENTAGSSVPPAGASREAASLKEDAAVAESPQCKTGSSKSETLQNTREDASGKKPESASCPAVQKQYAVPRKEDVVPPRVFAYRKKSCKSWKQRFQEAMAESVTLTVGNQPITALDTTAKLGEQDTTGGIHLMGANFVQPMRMAGANNEQPMGANVMNDQQPIRMFVTNNGRSMEVNVSNDQQPMGVNVTDIQQSLTEAATPMTDLFNRTNFSGDHDKLSCSLKDSAQGQETETACVDIKAETAKLVKDNLSENKEIAFSFVSNSGPSTSKKNDKQVSDQQTDLDILSASVQQAGIFNHRGDDEDNGSENDDEISMISDEDTEESSSGKKQANAGAICPTGDHILTTDDENLHPTDRTHVMATPVDPALTSDDPDEMPTYEMTSELRGDDSDLAETLSTEMDKVMRSIDSENAALTRRLHHPGTPQGVPSPSNAPQQPPSPRSTFQIKEDLRGNKYLIVTPNDDGSIDLNLQIPRSLLGL